MKDKLLSAVSILIPPLLIFVGSVAEIITRNLSDFSGGIGKSVEPFVIAAAIYTAVGITLLSVSKAGRLRVIYYAYLLTAPAWYIFQITKDFLPSSDLSLIITGVVFSIGVFLLRRAPLKLVRDSVVVFGTVILAGNAFTLAQIEQRVPADATFARAGPVQTNPELPNIYHIVLDEFQSDLFQIHLDDRLKIALSGFRLYPNATTPFGRTETALAATFSGIEYAYDEPLYDYVARSFTQDSMIKILRSIGYRTTAVLWTPYHQFKSKAQTLPSQFDTIYWQIQMRPELSAGDHSAILAAMWFYKHFPTQVVSMVVAPHHLRQLKNGALLPNDAPLKSMLSFRDLMNRETTQTDHGRYVFVHLMLPHFPEVLGADCQCHFGKLTLPRDQARCTISLIEEFVERLKELDRFESSLILIHADHGKWMYFRDGDLVAANTDFTGLDWNWGRSRPLVLFKPAGASADDGSLLILPQSITLLDIAPTVLDSLDLPVNSTFSGQSLLTANFPNRPVRYYHMYDKNPLTVINGDLRRYSVTDNRFVFDSEIPIRSLP